MLGYKVFNPNFKCLNYQFEVGKTYIHSGEVRLCKSGFHFCEKPADCFSYYSFNSNNIVCEILADDVSSEKELDSKRVCGKITILRKLNWQEVLEIVNSGYRNSGYRNSGDHNSGNYNSGYRNSGYRNSGDHNSGYHNSGNYNSGNYNSGNYNSGYHNSGNYNSGNYNSGLFNNTEPTLRIFGKDSGLFKNQIDIPIFPIYLTKEIDNKPINVEYKQAWKLAWKNAPQSEKDKLFNLKDIKGNLLFDAEIFKDITGIDVNETP